MRFDFRRATIYGTLVLEHLHLLHKSTGTLGCSGFLIDDSRQTFDSSLRAKVEQEVLMPSKRLHVYRLD